MRERMEERKGVRKKGGEEKGRGGDGGRETVGP